MPLLQNEVICITGASRGIGECLANCLAQEGAKKLVLIAEDEEGLKTTADKAKSAGAKGVETLTCDLADPKAVQALADKLAGMGVTCLINNAGVFLGGEDDPLKGKPEDFERMMKVNAMAPMRLIRVLAPKMADKGHGAIICVGDVEAFHSGPKHGAYAASKFALRGFCKSSYEALRGKGIRVMNIAAGNVGGTAMAQQTGKQAGQGAIAPEDIAEAVLLPFRCSANCVPEEIVLKATQPGNA